MNRSGGSRPRFARPVGRIRGRAVRTAALVSGVIVVVGIWTFVSARVSPADTAPILDRAKVAVPQSGGTALNSGGSSTAFTLVLPPGAGCTGDSANDDYRVNSFMVPASVDPTTLNFGGTGPVPAGTGTSFREALYAPPGGTPYANAQTAAKEPSDTVGRVVNIPSFDFSVWAPGQIPAGEYLIGIACTKGSQASTTIDKVWEVELTFATSASDTPAGVTWKVSSTQPSLATTTSTTATTAASSTTTTVGGSSTTTATTGAGETGTATSDPSTTAGTAPLAATGSNPLPLVAWGLLLLWLGRMAVLIGKRTRVRSRGQP